MADTKISALTAATTPLAGTEVLPIVQSGVTKQVSVANLTAGRAVSADSLALTGSPLPATSGGTGQSSYAVGDLLYASTTTALSKLADVATGNALISGGVGVAPSWGKIDLTTHVSGTLPVANGGTGNTTGAATAVTSNATTGVMQIVGPAASSTRVMTIPNANFTAARTDAGQTFIGDQIFSTTGYITLPVGTTAQRPGSPTTGMIRYNSDLSDYEVYDDGSWNPLVQGKYFTADFLVIAGGGGGCANAQRGGGGGGGGYRTSAGTSGGGASAESALNLVAGYSYTVTVGAGGPPATQGSNSVFSTITSTGGGKGGNSQATGGSGGSGGGGGNAGGAAGSGTASQGYNGGPGTNANGGGGGGGAGSAGAASATGLGGNGGSGVASSITGSSVSRAGGGGGSSNGTAGTGTDGGGAGAVSTSNATSGTANTGGGGGSVWDGTTSGSGGSGFVVIKYPSTLTISNPGGGLTFTTSTSGGYNITQFTAGTGIVTFA